MYRGSNEVEYASFRGVLNPFRPKTTFPKILSYWVAGGVQQLGTVQCKGSHTPILPSGRLLRRPRRGVFIHVIMLVFSWHFSPTGAAAYVFVREAEKQMDGP